MKKAHISLPTIHCESCTKLIGMTLKTIPGITKKTFDIDKRSLVIEFDSSTTDQTIIETIINDAGYEAKLESEEDLESALHPIPPEGSPLGPLLQGEGASTYLPLTGG